MKRNLLFIIALFACAVSFGQSELDAYRYSNNDLSGTARGQAMGGAFGALGGDVTGVAINPAGIGIYRSSEIVANMSLTSPLINGNTNQGNNTKFNFNNLSYIGYYPLVKGSMLTLNFGFNYNRIKSFDQRYSASRPEMKSSLTDYMVMLTNGIYSSSFDEEKDPYGNPNIPWLSALAWKGYLINPKNGANSNQYESILHEGERVSPTLEVREKGRIESYDFTIGSNISDKFYWGATVSITDLSYVMASYYNENFSEGGGFNLRNYLETQGSGFQMKVGVIYKPVDALRIGLSYHSPVWYTMTDYFNASLSPRDIIDENGNEAGRTETPLKYDHINYYLRTPGSLTFSLAAVLGTKAILSLDYENKNYSAINLKDNDQYDNKYVNKLITEDYKSTSTVRAGVEYRFSPQFSGRLGYAWMQNPYQSDIKATGKVVETAGTIPHYTLSGDVNYLTAGFGFRFTPQFYGDFALVLRTQKDDLYYFSPVVIDGVEADSFQDTFTNRTLKGLITLGYKF